MFPRPSRVRLLGLLAASVVTAGLSSVAAVPAAAAHAAAASVDSAAFSLTATDDFTGTTLNKSVWSVFNNPTGKSLHSAKNVVVHDGMLSLLTQYDAAAGQWTTAGMCACGNPALVHTYGAYEIRARVSAGDSRAVALLWPTQGWPPEIDFMEMGGAGAEGTRQLATQTVHYGRTNSMIHSSYAADMTQWHTVGVEWGPGYVRYSLDGVVTRTVASPVVSAQPMWLGLSTAPMTSKLPTVPVSFDVDWVKWYSYVGGPGAAPQAPTTVSAVGGDTSATVTWAPPVDDGNSPLTSYTVTASPGGATTNVTGPPGALPTTATLHGLTPNVAYSFTVHATNSFGVSTESDPASAVPTGTAPTVTSPPVPHLTAFSSVGSTGALPVTVGWAAAPGSAAVCSYHLQRSIAGAGYVDVPLARKLTTSVTDLVSPGLPVQYQVQAVGCNGLTSDWLAGPATSGTVTEDSDPGVTYAGTWTQSACVTCSGGTTTATTGKGATSTVQVTGSEAAVIANTGPSGSAVGVYVDGTLLRTVYTYGKTAKTEVLVTTVRFAQPGVHTLMLRNVASSGHPTFTLDAIAALS